MGSGRGASLRVRAGLLAAIVVPLALLAGAPADAWHEGHADERECAVCHFAHYAADLPRPVALVAARAAGTVEPEGEARKVPSRRSVRRPARAPPA